MYTDFEESFQKSIVLLATITDQLIDKIDTELYRDLIFNCRNVNMLRSKIEFVSKISKINIEIISINDETDVVRLRFHK